ncbi:uncharacterized protein MYCFIDRAFT_206083, partial [Pseudocercospora fijiensis CIRAD86]
LSERDLEPSYSCASILFFHLLLVLSGNSTVVTRSIETAAFAFFCFRICIAWRGEIRQNKETTSTSASTIWPTSLATAIER